MERVWTSLLSCLELVVELGVWNEHGERELLTVSLVRGSVLLSRLLVLPLARLEEGMERMKVFLVSVPDTVGVRGCWVQCLPTQDGHLDGADLGQGGRYLLGLIHRLHKVNILY